MYNLFNGELGIEDVRFKKTALKFNIGKERGLI